MDSAPLYDAIAGGPEGGSAWWCKTSDGVRIRVAIWPREGARGSVLLFPGRTEYIEKYGATAQELARLGLATLAVDWRGQGLADRLLPDARIGHVVAFPDYQKDVAAVLALAEAQGLPKPWHLIGHSMGGAIGLRALIQGAPVATATFTGPMWGIYMSALLKPLGWALPRVANMVGMGTRLPPSTTYDPYVLSNPFPGNMLTTDPGMFAMMQEQLRAQPGLALGGPSLIWLREAMGECAWLARQPSPRVPCVTFIGENERIVDTAAVRARMQRWPGGELVVLPGAEHEVLLEQPALRARLFARFDALVSGGGTATARSA
ncbi:MAG: alpha/beta hydrolase [Pseudooceanicola sp.]|nr:alpha/beta hydrolase [Pseudooceanicola sp.]